ncbi:MAG TPA: glycine C-acetyltransferase, partial [Gammaproteobacteria bacterium]|nr:glycine C-acetyltransferase [Gammaproteobacteria bacterium]
MFGNSQARLESELDGIRRDGLYKDERIITTPQGAEIRVSSGAEVINFCANNYLGLADDARVIDAAKKALEDHGFGMASV